MKLKKETIEKILQSIYFTEREKKMLRFRIEEKTLKEIGDRFNITAERVRQIINEKIPLKTAKYFKYKNY